MRVRVLIADDFALFRAGVSNALEAYPTVEVIGHAADGLEALELARELRPDVLVLDLRMPGLGGKEVLDACHEELPEIKILILTANENPDNLQETMAAGAAGYLNKATTGEKLCDALITLHEGGSVVAPSRVAQRNVSDSGDELAAERTSLTLRERRIVRLLSKGLTDKEIAEELFIGVRTVQYDLAKVREKTGISGRSEIARWAIIHSLA